MRSENPTGNAVTKAKKASAKLSHPISTAAVCYDDMHAALSVALAGAPLGAAAVCRASIRGSARGLDQEMIAALIETGGVKQKDIEHWWIFKELPGRDDNLVCAAVISRQAIIIKTIMTHWEEQNG